MASYSIRELERLSGIKAATLRMWEKRYGVITPKRTSTNIRYYDDSDLRKLLNLSILNRKGLRISQLAEFGEDRLRSMVLEHSLGDQDQDEQLQQLTLAMIQVDDQEFERAFDGLVGKYGFEESFFRFIIPFLRNVGCLWHCGSIEPAQEHFVSQLIRRKLMSGIEQVPHPEERMPSFLMFLPEGELHDIGLLFGHYLAKKAGHRVCYLGASVPFEDLQKLASQYSYPNVLTAFIEPIDKEELDRKVKEYLDIFPRSNFFLTGPQVHDGDELKDVRLHVIESVEALKALIGPRKSSALSSSGG